MTIVKATRTGREEHTLFIGEYHDRSEAQQAIKVLKAVGQWPKRHHAKIID